MRRVVAMRNGSLHRTAGLFVLGLSILTVAWLLRVDLVWLVSTPVGGDLAGHVWWPAFLRDHLLPEWRVSGWSMDLFAGFPAGRFYFPLPALLVVALDTLLPYGVAFKVVLVAGSVLTPLASFWLGRSLGLGWLPAALMAWFSVVYLVVPTGGRVVVGGNLESTLAGEFAWSLAVPVGLAALGSWFWWLGSGRPSRWVTAVLLALTVLSHVVVGGVVVLWLVLSTLIVFRRSWLSLLLPVGVAGLVAGVWLFPFLVSLPYTTDPGFPRLTSPVVGLVGFGAWWMLPLAIVAVLLVRHRHARSAIWAMGSMAAVAGSLVLVWPSGLALANSRLLPFWHLAVALVAALGLGWLIEEVQPVKWQPVLAVLVMGLSVLMVGSDVLGRGRATIVMGGVEATSGWQELRHLTAAISELPPGRVGWERLPELNSYGSPFAFQLLPFWTDGRFPVWDGVYVEASATSPFVERASLELSARGRRRMSTVESAGLGDFDLGVRHLQLLGVRYFLAASEAVKARAHAHNDLVWVRSVDGGETPVVADWDVFEVQGSELVSGLPFEPVVVDVGRGDWRDMAESWFVDEEGIDVILTASGPVSWEHSSDAETAALARAPLPPVGVSNVVVEQDRVSFRVDRVGIPALVKVSFFPGWVVEGGLGPYRATPNLMVVVPTESEVSLRFGSTAMDDVGRAASVVGGLALVVTGWRDRRLSRRRPASRKAIHGGESRKIPALWVRTMTSPSRFSTRAVT